MEWIILGAGALLFLCNVALLIFIVGGFASMKARYLLMEQAFKDYKKMIEEMQLYISRGFESTEDRYDALIDEYKKVLNSNNALQERINRIERTQKKPLAPDVILN